MNLESSFFFQEIPYTDPIGYLHLAMLFLDSCDKDRYSFIALDPLEIALVKDRKLFINNIFYSQDPFSWMEEIIKKFERPHIKELPPFQGGLAGYLSYEMVDYLEDLPMVSSSCFPDMILGVFDKIIAFDHSEKKAWIMASTKKRLKDLLESLKIKYFPYDFLPSMQSEITKHEYVEKIEKIKDYIASGDIYQANFTRKISGYWPSNLKSQSVYTYQRTKNPSPFSAFFSYKNINLLSSSPECFFKMNETGYIETFPMKGTRPRDQEYDEQLKKELKQSQKDQAENLMIVDLMRNDLARIADHICVPELFKIETYPTVHQMVSKVCGYKKGNITAIDVLKAIFPGGSITGAPKIRAIEILRELEKDPRGPYCGSIGYIGFSQTMCMNIAIRTLCRHQNEFYIQVGGGIVYDSIPQDEYQETKIKAKSFYELRSQNI